MNLRPKGRNRTDVYTFEITHKGVTNLIVCDAQSEQALRQTISGMTSNANAEAAVAESSIKRHDNNAAAQAYVAEYRTSRGKPAVPTQDELVANASKLFVKPELNKPEDDDADE